MARRKTSPSKGGADREHATSLLPRPVIWVGSSKDEISALPAPVKASFGHRLRQVQDGGTPLEMKPLPQFGSGVFELRERYDKNAYRLMYVVNLKKAVYVLHAFMKKSKSGIGIPKPDAELLEARLKRAQTLDAED
ncbi:MAG: type II toxin-antitoxin system RelE/ParE family toxin [Terriglobia bacterium]